MAIQLEKSFSKTGATVVCSEFEVLYDKIYLQSVSQALNSKNIISTCFKNKKLQVSLHIVAQLHLI